MVQYVTWGGQTNLKQGQLSLAQQYADAGMMARARAAFEAAGGTWNNAVHKQLKQEATDTTRYGGDINFNWADYGVRTQDQLNQIIVWAKAGNFNEIAKLINGLGGAKKFNDSGNRLHKKLAAEYLGTQGPDTDPNKVGVQPGEKTTEFKRVDPAVDPQLYPNVTDSGTGDTTTDWRTQFVAPITTDAWSEAGSQARLDAKKWRDLHMNVALKDAGLTRVGNNPIQRSTTISNADWDAFKVKRDKIADRHKKMVGIS